LARGDGALRATRCRGGGAFDDIRHQRLIRAVAVAVWRRWVMSVRTCEKAHPLTKIAMTGDRRHCSKCGEDGKQLLPERATMYLCEPCDYGLCEDCMTFEVDVLGLDRSRKLDWSQLLLPTCSAWLPPRGGSPAEAPRRLGRPRKLPQQDDADGAGRCAPTRGAPGVRKVRATLDGTERCLWTCRAPAPPLMVPPPVEINSGGSETSQMWLVQAKWQEEWGALAWLNFPSWKAAVDVVPESRANCSTRIKNSARGFVGWRDDDARGDLERFPEWCDSAAGPFANKRQIPQGATHAEDLATADAWGPVSRGEDLARVPMRQGAVIPHPGKHTERFAKVSTAESVLTFGNLRAASESTMVASMVRLWVKKRQTVPWTAVYEAGGGQGPVPDRAAGVHPSRLLELRDRASRHKWYIPPPPPASAWVTGMATWPPPPTRVNPRDLPVRRDPMAVIRTASR
jgi:hypothetical protein